MFDNLSHYIFIGVLGILLGIPAAIILAAILALCLIFFLACSLVGLLFGKRVVLPSEDLDASKPHFFTDIESLPKVFGHRLWPAAFIAPLGFLYTLFHFST